MSLHSGSKTHPSFTFHLNHVKGRRTVTHLISSKFVFRTFTTNTTTQANTTFHSD